MWQPRRITLHHSLTEDSKSVSWGAIRHYHVHDPGHRWSDIGYHWGVEWVGDDSGERRYEILMGRVGRQGAHVRGENDRNVGICLVGNFDLAEPPPEQWLLGLRLVSWLMDLHHIGVSQVKGHREYAPDRSCPGLRFDLAKFRNCLVNDHYI